jgi:ABC-type sugar transport system ATPase subunit
VPTGATFVSLTRKKLPQARDTPAADAKGLVGLQAVVEGLVDVCAATQDEVFAVHNKVRECQMQDIKHDGEMQVRVGEIQTLGGAVQVLQQQFLDHVFDVAPTSFRNGASIRTAGCAKNENRATAARR